MKTPHDVIVKPVLTEKSYDQLADKVYTIIVEKKANKTEIGKAVEEIFGVKVSKVNTMNYDGKVKRMGAGRPGRRAGYKKAVVTLTEDSKTIEFFEGMV